MMDLLTACPNFGSFFSSLDKKNKRMVISITEFVEFKSMQKLINAGTPVNEIIVVLKGEVIFFGQDGPSTIFKSGDILGVVEMVYGMNWKEDAFGRQNGYLIIIK